MTGIFLVRLGMRGNFEAALSRVTVARSRAGGRVWNKQQQLSYYAHGRAK